MQRLLLIAGLSAAAFAFQALPASAAFTLSSDPAAGNGSVSSITATGFVLTGADFLDSDSLGGFSYTTYYTDTAAADITVTFDWAFSVDDTPNDAGGFVVDGSGTLLSLVPGSGSGESFTVSSGQTYGWFVYSSDSLHGPGILTVSNIDITTNAVGAPEPVSLAVLGAACGMLGLARRKGRARRD